MHLGRNVKKIIAPIRKSLTYLMHYVDIKDLCMCDRWVHRYTRWTGRLSHQTNNLSCPCNLLLKGCDLCFTQYWVQGDAGSNLPS